LKNQTHFQDWVSGLEKQQSHNMERASAEYGNLKELQASFASQKTSDEEARD